MTIHKVKSWPHLFEATLDGTKTHELRRFDRDYKVGDELELHEFDPKTNTYTGRKTTVWITYITDAANPCAESDSALNKDYCILSVE